MNRGAQINEETIVPGGEKPVGSAVQSHDTTKAGVPARGFAATVTTIESLINTTIQALCASFGDPNPGTYLGEWNRQTIGEAL
ncbi:MAG TPA: hypothetical protein VFP47_15540 [Pyrinomonadaceae bacterium]|nr:hypothetical protein [Pyrinomonadaceae bacterium]